MSTQSGKRYPADIVILALGVRPDTTLAKMAGIEIGERGGIRVDEQMRTSNPDIFAVGDAVEVRDFVTGEWSLIALAGPANRQGRIAADVIAGRDSRFRGTQGTAIVGLFGAAVAWTGANEKTLDADRRHDYEKVYLYPNSHAGYYPGAKPIAMKVIFRRSDGRVLGAQAVGEDGVDKRISELALAIQLGATVYDLEQAELCYAPPFGSAKDPINFAGHGRSRRAPRRHAAQPLGLRADGFLLDVREKVELAVEQVPDAVNIPLGELRSRLDELPRDREIRVDLPLGPARLQRDAAACVQNGFDARVVSGGMLSHAILAARVSREPGGVACTAEQAELGEGARWDARRGELLRVDILDGRVYRDRVDDDGGLVPVRSYRLPGTVGAITPVEGDDGWLLAAGRGFAHLTPAGTVRPLAEAASAGTRMNDGACDPHGRFWAGTLAADHRTGGGALYRLDRSGRVELMLDGLTIANGLDWSPDGATMYLVDSGPGVVNAFAFDSEPGTISQRRALVTVPGELGAPDGMTVDADGDLWVAVYGGGAVHRYSPDGVLREKLHVPARQSTSCAFAGRGLSRLYVTTATEDWSEEQRRADPAAGLTYRFETDATGRPASPFRPDAGWWRSATGPTGRDHPGEGEGRAPSTRREHVPSAGNESRRRRACSRNARPARVRPLRRKEAMTDTPLDELGPVDYLVVEFPAGASNFTGEMATELVTLVDAGTIRVIDVLILTKNEDGSVDAMELSDIEELGELQQIEAELAELLAEEDVVHLAAAMDPGSTAGVLIWENLWAAPFAAAARRSGGQLIANGRIPIQAIIASIEADEALTTEGD